MAPGQIQIFVKGLQGETTTIDIHKASLDIRYLASRGFFLLSLLPCTKSFEFLVFRVVGSKQANYPNDFAHAKIAARQKETSTSRVDIRFNCMS